MKNRFLQFVCAAVIASFTLASCSKDSGTTTTAISTSVNSLNATGSDGHFTFYSLETGQQISNTDSATTKWDIAFRSTTILINGGTSGPANGGAFVQKGVTFDTYNTISSDSTFKIDGMNGVARAITTGSGNGWYSYNFSTDIISPIAGNIIIIRTANGKYAKVEIQSYYQNAPIIPDANSVSRYYTFRYVFQVNGSKSFN
ncbi:MAG: HmuY family protein [Bacteroidetes bacterium]|nr:HmuY family protein [Bacteroidota bacterium]MBS1649759.1 HmuY family protein [Bacteroidota bacterium]